MNERDIFITALEKTDSAQRSAWLDQACAGNSDLRRRVEILLRAHERANSFLDAPFVDEALAGAIRPELPTATVEPSGEAGENGSLDFLAPPEQPGQLGKLDGYEVLEVVGAGGMGVVLKAFDPKLRRVVALKAMASHLAAHANARRRFEREARAIAAVRNEHVVAVYEIEPDAPTPYLVMEFISGISLQERLEQRGPLDVKEILRIGMQAASGLAAAHAQGIVHRDIKPANILLENGVERVKLSDFGLARAVNDAGLTQSGTITGTPYYMSPEQASAEPVDHRSDLFSLGAVLYALCAGHPPFRAETPLGVLKRVCEDEPRPIREVNPDIPGWLEAIVLKLLAKDPKDRFQSAGELADLLGRHLAHLQQPGTVPKPKDLEDARHRPRRRRRFRYWLVEVAAAIILLLILAGAMSGIFSKGWITRLNTGGRTVAVFNNDRNAEVIVSAGVNRVVYMSGGGSGTYTFRDDRELSLSIIKDREIHYEIFRLRPGEHREIRIPPIVLSSRLLRLKVKSGRLETKQIYAMRLSPDQHWVAVWLWTGTLKVFDLADGVERWSFPVPEKQKLGFDFSPDSKWLAFIIREGVHQEYVIVSRNLATGEVGPTLRPSRETFLIKADTLAFSPDGKQVAVSSTYNPAYSRVLRWSWPEGKPLSHVEWPHGGIAAIQYSPDSKVLAALTEQGIGNVRFDAGTPSPFLEFYRQSPSIQSRAVAVSSDGKLAAATYDGRGVLTIYKPGDSPPKSLYYPIQFACVAFSPDGKLIAAGNCGLGSSQWEQRAAVRLWIVDSGEEKALLLGHSDWVLDLQFTENGKEMATASKDGSIMFWRLP